MSTTAIERAPKQEIEARPITPLSLIQDALHKGVPPEVLKELVALQQSMIRFDWEAQERQAKIDFDNALNQCQAKIGRVAPNVQRNDTRSMWADYVQLDRAIRPIYTEAGFSVSFSEVAPINPAKVRIMGTLSRGGVSREFFAEITPSTTGAKGNALVNATDADAIAQSRAKRYILLDMFNIAIGIDKEEKKGIPDAEAFDPMPDDRLQEWKDALEGCAAEQFEDAFFKAHDAAGKDENAHLALDEWALRKAPNLAVAQKIFRPIWEKWKKFPNSGATGRVTKAYEETKVRLGGKR